jgi:hypothetical protein
VRIQRSAQPLVSDSPKKAVSSAMPGQAVEPRRWPERYCGPQSWRNGRPRATSAARPPKRSMTASQGRWHRPACDLPVCKVGPFSSYARLCAHGGDQRTSYCSSPQWTRTSRSHLAQQARSNFALRTHANHHAPALLLWCNALLREGSWWALWWGSLDGMQGVSADDLLPAGCQQPHLA